MKTGEEALLILTRPSLHLVAVRIARVWTSKAKTERVEVSGLQRTGFPFRPSASFDRRQFIPLSVLENLSTAPAEKSAAKKTAGAGAV